MSRTLRDRLRGDVSPLRCYTTKSDDTLTNGDRQKTKNKASNFRKVDQTKSKRNQEIHFVFHCTSGLGATRCFLKKFNKCTKIKRALLTVLLPQVHLWIWSCLPAATADIFKVLQKEQVNPDPLTLSKQTILYRSLL